MVCENHYFYVAHPHAKIEWALKSSARKNRKSQKKNKTPKPNPNTSQPPPPSSLVDPPLPSPPVVVPHLPSLPAMDPHRRRLVPTATVPPPLDPCRGGRGRAAASLPLEPTAGSALGRARESRPRPPARARLSIRAWKGRGSCRLFRCRRLHSPQLPDQLSKPPSMRREAHR